MKRDYINDENNNNVIYFAGNEVEHTPAYGLKTLFVVGVRPVNEILSKANFLQCKAIYFGANMSFGVADNSDLMAWVIMIQGALDHPDNYWCTLDFDVKYCEKISRTILTRHPQFIPMISVKMPYVRSLGYNAVIKIDDKDFEYSNAGVWCHRLHDLMATNKFTFWKQYKDDEII